ncbi:hypothetical protein SAMD00019534_009200, partial [Acytostelium subglobosum LB1]|uniref:hypothetical protein n=1 Tax=Acytostelium subglobosum LB1 TaxID=1410327 RepID=UPI000644CD28
MLYKSLANLSGMTSNSVNNSQVQTTKLVGGTQSSNSIALIDADVHGSVIIPGLLTIAPIDIVARL